MTLHSVIINIIYIFITVCGAFVLAEILDYVNCKIDDIQVSTKMAKHEQLNRYIDDAQEVITIAVKTVNQTYVDELKKAGSFTDEAKIEAKSKAIMIAKKLIMEKGVGAIKELYGDFEDYLDYAIEKAVNESKIYY